MKNKDFNDLPTVKEIVQALKNLVVVHDEGWFDEEATDKEYEQAEEILEAAREILRRQKVL